MIKDLSFNFLSDEKWRKEFGLQKTQAGPKSHKRPSASTGGEAYSRNIPKKKFLLPWWCVYVGWFLVIVSVGSSIFFLWAYGLQFGNVRTGKWLTSLTISFFSSVLLTEPLKVRVRFIVWSFLLMVPIYF